MTIYQAILEWSGNKSNFLRDALRRIITSNALLENDIDELIQLLKKEEGDTSVVLNSIPLDESHLPSSTIGASNYPRLIEIKNPINICALHEQASLKFANNGLNIVFGNNGSGKSSYSRILKKLCWSRDNRIELKKNVFSVNQSSQNVEFIIEENSVNQSFVWSENNPSHAAMNSFFVFDSNCGNIYLNQENPTEYKPVGIDVLEKLTSVMGRMALRLENNIRQYNSLKPLISENLATTPSGLWYQNIERITTNNVDTHINLSNQDKKRKEELLELLKTSNPEITIKNLTGLRDRLDNYTNQIKNIECYYNQDNLKTIIDLKLEYKRINRAYEIAMSKFETTEELSGFGTEHWIILWNAAKSFAVKENMTEEGLYPSGKSMEKCILCKQDLDQNAQKRLQSFNEFVSNDISRQVDFVKKQIESKIASFDNVIIPPLENFNELTKHIDKFNEKFKKFTDDFDQVKQNVKQYFTNDTQLNISQNILSKEIEGLKTKVSLEIKSNLELSKDRTKLEQELKELLAKEFLFSKKPEILQYHKEYLYKAWIGRCKSKLNTTQISKKIGDLMDNQAVSLQHQEFISHLDNFNQDLSSKIAITKTRTTSGTTFQKCSFSAISDGMNLILSEGEQKIVALSNFLAECTIDNRKNTIILDDPVNSLDMNYRDSIAEKIVQLSRERQIIILTHDLSFLRLLIDTHRTNNGSDCEVIGIDKYNGIAGIVTDEIPYLAKNVDERIDSIRRILREHDALNVTDAHGRETKLDSARKRFRMLIEKTVEEILSNKTYQRFSKNIILKKYNLSGYIVTEQNDIDFLLNLFSKYSVTEHDGGVSTISQLPNAQSISQDIRDYLSWKTEFKRRLKEFNENY